MPEIKPKKHELKTDKFSRAREGHSEFLDLHCADCKKHVALYQKDGPGDLRRMYLDRIYEPSELAKLRDEHSTHKGMPNLDCPECKKQLGTPMTYEPEDRLAFRVHRGAFERKRSAGVYPPQKDQEPEKLVGRDAIHNVWDHDTDFRKIKSSLVENVDPKIISEIYESGINLLKSDQPYQVKLGIHLGRLCIWRDSNLAQEWLMNVAPDLLSHSHPRVRHSALWNLRSANWQDPGVASYVLEYGKAGLLDPDPAVQRVAMWTLGDSIIADPSLFNSANEAMLSFLRANPRESNCIFALEEFYSQLQKILGLTPEYKNALQEIKEMAIGLPGLRARTMGMLGETFEITEDEENKSIERVAKISPQTKELIDGGKYDDAIRYLAFSFRDAKTFAERMKNVWLARDLLWSNPDNAVQIFTEFAKNITDTSDGDIIRTMSVVLGDCVLVKPEELCEIAIRTVRRFFESSDIDGSQIVMSQILSPLARGSDKVRKSVIQSVSELDKNSANKSVTFALNNLINY